ncbi:MAG TPA: phospholipid carrier-dependent glycosyltransferase [Pyrinomonadaceae bacterium]|jgi:uncharacterized protein (TIGR03663 family)
MAKKPKKQLDETEDTGEQIVNNETSNRYWLPGSLFVVFAAAVLRLVWLPFKPFHHDEGVNGWFMTNLVRQGVFKYDPQNYHGPTLYYFTLVSTYLFGLTDFAVRFVTAFFGILLVVLILYLRRYIGTVGALAAAMLVALSPGMSFISRYYIHEILFVFFTLAVVVAVLQFMERERAGQAAIGSMSLLLLVCLLPGTINFANAIGGANQLVKIGAGLAFFAVEVVIVYFLMRSLAAWNEGRPIYLLLAAASASLTFATKETAFISFGTIAIAIFCVFVWRKLWAEDKNGWSEPVEFSFKNFFAAFGDRQSRIVLIALCIVVFAYVWVLFFTSFFTYPEGVKASFKAYDLWAKTGTKDHADNGLLAYLRWGMKVEAPIFILGALGAALAFWKARHRFAMFAALWGFGVFMAYTLIPYKTPWLALNFLLPIAIAAGYGINELAVSRQMWQRAAAAFLAAIAFGVCAYQAIDLNFYRYDDDSMPYVYAHTRRAYNEMLVEIDRIAEKSGKNNETSIIVASPDYWGLPWSLRDYPNAGFYGQITPTSTAEIVIGKTDQQAKLEEEYGRHYQSTGTYALRPGVDLVLYVRKDLAK